ncbi:MAG: hypothetical protein JWN17_1949 [Frankiales bacterium]|nr:hypothetical protein [Frankiales bacterium]
MSQAPRRPLRVGTFSGYLGDRPTALSELMAGDPVDVAFGDYLAEVTLAALAARRARDPERAFVEQAVEQLRPHLVALAERGTKVVTNAGGFSPAGMAAALREAAAAAGADLRVAHVSGDDVLPHLADHAAAGHLLEHLETGEPLSSWSVPPLAANAYLGGWGIAAALAAGADVVVCGRVADASLLVGAAAWWHGWAVDDWDALAGAVVAGHVLECGPQAVGGNFSGFTSLPDVLVPGFPVGEVAADGSCVVTKHVRDGGAVTVDTVTAQLVYEVQGPVYLNPDVTVDLSTVRLSQEAPDRVLVHGATGCPPPATTKVAVFGVLGWQAVGSVFLTAPDVAAKAALVSAQVSRDLPDGVELSFTQVGTAAEDAASQWEATVALRVLATAPEREDLARLDLAGRLGSLYLQSVPGFFHDLAAGLSFPARPRIAYWPALLDQACVTHVAVLDDGEVLPAPLPPRGPVVAQPLHPEPLDPPSGAGTWGDTVRVPLGTVAHARSGDKGGNSNVGVWVADPDAWPWLRATLTTAALRALLPDTADLEVVRHELPHLRAVHFVLKGLLDEGGSSNRRLDQVGKAVGEHLRSRHVDVPVALVRS